MLFPEPDRERTTALGWAEPAVRFLATSTRPEAVQARRTVNRWYDDFTDPRQHLARTLRSDENVKHYQALDELFVHSRLRLLHDDVRYEEEAGAPDFRIYDNGVLLGGVEVASLFQPSDRLADGAAHARLADYVNDRLYPSSGYYVIMELEEARREPPPRRFLDWLTKRITALPDPSMLTLPQAATRQDLPSAIFPDDGVRIRVWFLPMEADAPAMADPDARLIVTSAAVGGPVTAVARFVDRVNAKAGGRYLTAGAPLSIVLANHDFTLDRRRMHAALYGEPPQKSPSVFGTGRSGRPRNVRLSAVTVVDGLMSWVPEDTRVTLARNPRADRRWPEGLLPATDVFIDAR